MLQRVTTILELMWNWMPDAHWVTYILLLLHLALQFGLAFRVIMRRRSVGESR